MIGYYQAFIQIITAYGYAYSRQAKGSHEVWIKRGAHGEMLGRIQVPRHLNDKHFANKLLKDANISERIK